MRSFDLLAPFYDGMEGLLAGEKLKRCRQAHLDQLSTVRKALLVGEGHGRFLTDLLKSNAEVEITYVDASEGMLSIAHQRLARQSLPLSRVSFQHSDVLTWEPDQSYDFIATQFFLDCFTKEQLGEIVERLARAATPKGLWLVCDFQIPPTGPARWRAQAIHWLMYRFFRVFTKLPASHLTPPGPFLKSQGFIPVSRSEFDWGLLYSQLWRRSSHGTQSS